MWWGLIIKLESKLDMTSILSPWNCTVSAGIWLANTVGRIRVHWIQEKFLKIMSKTAWQKTQYKTINCILFLVAFVVVSCFFFAETFRSFFADTFWSLKHFGHLSHSCVKTCCNSVYNLYFQTSWAKWLGHFKKILVYDWNKTQVASITFHSLLKQGFQTFLPEGDISYYTTVWGADIF